MASFSVTLRGIDEFRAMMKGLGNDMADVLEEAATDGAMIVVKAAQENSAKGGSFPHRITGNLFRSIPAVSPVTISKTSDRVEVGIGSAAEYARRLELGFTGVDSRGRIVMQGPRPWLRPALDDNAAAVEEAIKKRILSIIESRYL